jgi:phage tail sheath gpL-like
MADISITGVPASYRVPGGYVEILFAQGPAQAASTVREVVFPMPMLTGSWTAATLYEVPNEQTVIDGAGVGSMCHRAYRKFSQINKLTRVYCLPVAETSGGSEAAADFDVTWTTDPTAAGETTVRVCDEDCTYSFDDGTTDTVTTIAAGIAALINGKQHLPVTAANVAGVLTITARLKGISQGNGTLDVIPVRTKIDPGCGTTVSASGAVGDTTPGAEGSVTEAANLATALATIASRRIYYIVTSANDGTSWDNLISHITTKSTPNAGLRCVAIGAYTGGLSALQTLATGDNYERFQVVWQEASDHDSCELAAAVAAIRALHENTDPTYNLADYRGRDGGTWRINAAYAEADWPTDTDLNDAINDGITPIASDGSGSRLVMSVNTRSKNSGGTVNDFRACETHRVSYADYWADNRLSEWALNYQGKKFRNDEYLSDGVTVNSSQKTIRNVVRPSQLRAWLAKSIQDDEDAGHCQNAAASKAALRVIKSSLNSGRAGAEVNLHTIDHLHQFAMRVNEVSS